VGAASSSLFHIDCTHPAPVLPAKASPACSTGQPGSDTSTSAVLPAGGGSGGCAASCMAQIEDSKRPTCKCTLEEGTLLDCRGSQLATATIKAAVTDVQSDSKRMSAGAPLGLGLGRPWRRLRRLRCALRHGPPAQQSAPVRRPAAARRPATAGPAGTCDPFNRVLSCYRCLAKAGGDHYNSATSRCGSACHSSGRRTPTCRTSRQATGHKCIGCQATTGAQTLLTGRQGGGRPAGRLAPPP
jgi:hypothetical protein